MKRLLVLICLLALPIGLLPGPDGAWLWRLEQRWQAFAHAAPPTDSREQLERSLQDDPLLSGDLLAAWREAATLSLTRALPVTLPYAETLQAISGASGAPGPTALSWVLTLAPARVLSIETTASAGSRGGLLVEVFEAGSTQRAIAAAGPAPSRLRVPFDAWQEAAMPPRADRPPPLERRVLVRVQTTPAASGRFSIALQDRAPLDFPVDTDRERPVQSRFGVARDGGQRKHHGIDIFAPTGTPVLAAADGTIRRTGDSPRGGLHVWQHALDDDSRNAGALYYAHLDSVAVVAGQRVTRGTVLGTVGNTGNARTTPPHLHFGLYRRLAGPIDPLPFTGERRQRQIPPGTQAALPRWMAIAAPRANLRAGPGTQHDVVASARSGELLRIHALVQGGLWARVDNGRGIHAWVSRSLLGAVQASEPAPLGIDAALHAAPDARSPLLGRLSAASNLRTLGRFGDAVRVQNEDGLIGWTLSGRAADPL